MYDRQIDSLRNEIKSLLFSLIINKQIHNIFFKELYMAIIVESPAPSYNILWALVGSLIAAISVVLYYVGQKKVLNYLQEVWSIAHFWKITMPQALSFVGGTLLAGGVFCQWIGHGSASGISPFGPKVFLLRHTSVYGFALAGLLVGFGARMMHGGIHAHGYSEMAKRNGRSFLAVVVILLAGILGGTFATHNTIPFLTDGYRNPTWNLNHDISSYITMGLGVLFLIIGFILRRSEFNDMTRILKEMFTGIIFSFTFACGLMISGVSRRMNVVHGFSVFTQWSPVLFITIAATSILCFIFFLAASKSFDHSLFGEDFYKVSDQSITLQLIIGALCFGFGWGLSGVEIATWLLQFSVFTYSIGLVFGAFMIAGMYIAHMIESRSK